MDRNMEEKIPQVVEDRLQEAYDKIRKGEAGKAERAGSGIMDGNASRACDMQEYRKERKQEREQERKPGREQERKPEREQERKPGREQERKRERMQEENKKQSRRRNIYRNWTGIAAALVLAVAVPSVVFAAVFYFRKDTHRDEDNITYKFELNYELIPGEYQVMPDYIPEGMQDQGDGKYGGEGEQWITVMPVYTTAELEKRNDQITVEGVSRVEHMELSGMEADIITFPEAKKNQSPTYVFLFNERDGYVLEIIAGYGVGREELLEFADHLRVERCGDGRYETEEEKAVREREAKEEEARALGAAKGQEELLASGIPQDKIFEMGEELPMQDGELGYTVVDYEFLDSIAGFEEDKFFEYGRFDGWLGEDKSLKPYARRHFDGEGQLLSEDQAEQEILRVDFRVHCYGGQETVDAALDFELVYVEGRQDGSYTWREDYYAPVPEEGYSLQMDNSAVYLDMPVHTEGENRSHFFFRDMESGEDLYYTLLFVVDKDREKDFLLGPVGGNSSRWQLESETVQEIRDGLDGYIRLEQPES